MGGGQVRRPARPNGAGGGRRGHQDIAEHMPPTQPAAAALRRAPWFAGARGNRYAAIRVGEAGVRRAQPGSTTDMYPAGAVRPLSTESLIKW